MKSCLQSENCKNERPQLYGQKITKIVAAQHPGLLKKLDTIPNLIISSERNNNYFIGGAVDLLKQSVTPQCKSTIKPYNQFPFYYQYSGETEEQGRCVNLNCFFVDYVQFNNLQNCISIEHFNIYNKSRQIQVTWTEKKCKWYRIKHRCKYESHSRIDTVYDRLICYKQSNRVYDSFVEVAKKDLFFYNGGKNIINLFEELPDEGTKFEDSCIPNCSKCQHIEKCIKCEAQYSLINNQCIKCDSTCLTCSEENNSTKCLTCKEGLMFYDNQCIESCPVGLLNQNGTCQPCSDGCKVCENLSSNCIQCYDGKILFDNKCLNECNEGFYLNNLICHQCSIGCIECNSDQICKTCSKEFTKEGDICKQITNEQQSASQQTNILNILLILGIVSTIPISIILIRICRQSKLKNEKPESKEYHEMQSELTL